MAGGWPVLAIRPTWGATPTTGGSAYFRGPFSPHNCPGSRAVTGGPYRGIGPFETPPGGPAQPSYMAQYVAYCLRCPFDGPRAAGDQVYACFTWPLSAGEAPESVVVDRVPKAQAIFDKFTMDHDEVAHGESAAA